MIAICRVLMFLAIVCLAAEVDAVAPTDAELHTMRGWVKANFEPDANTIPLSFTYGNTPSWSLLANWRKAYSTERLDSNRTQRTLIFTDPQTGLQVRCVSVEFLDYPVVEWTVYLKNAGSADTHIIENLKGCDVLIRRVGAAELLLHHNRATEVLPQDYEPFTTVIDPGRNIRFAPPGGHPSRGPVMPYFNVQWQDGGCIVAVGWPGQWAAEFAHSNLSGLHIRTGQETTRLKLHPGEEVRTPRTAMLFWQGGYLRSQNLWRRWMMAHNVPRVNGRLPVPHLAACSGGSFPGLKCNEADEIKFIDAYLAEGIGLDCWHMDAGWYPTKDDWTHVGTWEVDKTRFPGGIRAVSDHAHSKGLKSLLWFEPERATRGSWLWNNHPEWLLAPVDVPPEIVRESLERMVADWRTLNLADAEALTWMTEHIDKTINEQQIDFYRHDFNVPPLYYWKSRDTEDRQGITENAYVTGFLAYLDELRRRHPNMLIDICQRFDIETLRRAVPRQRSEYQREPASQQAQTIGYASWIPFYGEGVHETDIYNLRSKMSSYVTLGYDMRTHQDLGVAKRLIKEWREIVSPNYVGDFYPLMPYSVAQDVWMAWQYDRPEVGEGIVQVFRRNESPYTSAKLILFGLDSDAYYSVSDLDCHTTQRISGRELTEQGLVVTIPSCPQAVILQYSKCPPTRHPGTD